MYNTKVNVVKTPDLTKMQAVKIDQRTTIYIAQGENPQEARDRYTERQNAKKF
jgi:hypothetical protein